MIQPIGYFLTWRGLYSKPIWLNSTLEQQVILMTLMAMANFKANEWEWQGEKFTVQPGQFITSLESIRINTGGNVSIQNIRTALKRFEKLGFLTNQSTKTGRLITLVNWQSYQVVDGELNIDSNKDLTKTQQRPNKDLTPIEEGNKDNNVNNSICMYDENLKKVISLLENNIGVTPPILIQEISSYTEIFDLDMFSEAIKIASNNKKRTVNYVLGILRQWKDNNILNLDSLEALRKEKTFERESKSNEKKGYNKAKKTRFHNFEQRSDKYSEEQLEEVADRKRREYAESRGR